MDNLTHGLVGALLGQAGLKRRTGLAMPALIIGANIPDIDATCTIYGIESLAMRRGLTHGPIAWVLLPLVLAGLLWGWDRWQARRGKRPDGRLPVHFGWLYALAFIACLTHPALDWLNSYGIRLLEPFSSRWFYGDALFIIDVWLWLGLGLATWWSLRRERRGGNSRRPARAALILATAYAGLNLVISESIETNAELNIYATRPDNHRVWVSAIANPQPLFFWRRELIVSAWDGRYVIPPESVTEVMNDTRLPARFRVGAAGCWRVDERISQRPDVRAFLFWSRVPFVERTAEGWLLRDARFTSRGARFSVLLPPGTCPPG